MFDTADMCFSPYVVNGCGGIAERGFWQDLVPLHCTDSCGLSPADPPIHGLLCTIPPMTRGLGLRLRGDGGGIVADSPEGRCGAAGDKDAVGGCHGVPRDPSGGMHRGRRAARLVWHSVLSQGWPGDQAGQQLVCGAFIVLRFDSCSWGDVFARSACTGHTHCTRQHQTYWAPISSLALL